MKIKTRFLLISTVLLGAATGAHAASIAKLSTGNLTDLAGWPGGLALPGTGDIAVFDDTSGFTHTIGSTPGLFFGGYQFTNTSNLTINAPSRTYTIEGGGIDMSSAGANVTFNGGFLRLRIGTGTTGTPGFNIASGRTLTVSDVNTNSNVFNSTLSGGGTLSVLGTFTGTGSNRLALNVTGSGTTVAGTGIYRPNNTSSGYGVRMGTGTFVSPGTTGIGNLTFSGAGTGETLLQMQAGAGLKFELGTGGNFVTPGTSDLLTLAAAALNDVTFANNNIDFLLTGSAGVFRLFDSDLAEGEATDAFSGLTLTGQEITGGFNVTNLASGFTGKLFLGDGTTTGDLGDIYLQVTAVPEPSAALLGGIGMLFLLRRRRA